MTTEPVVRRVVDAVERESDRGPQDLRAFRGRVLEELRHAIPFDWYAWVLTDPATEVGVDPVAAIPDLGELNRVIRLKYLTAVNRWTTLGSATTLGAARETSLLWAQAQSAHGVLDVASVPLRDRHGCWAFIDLWSTRLLDDGVARLLDRVAPALTAGVRRRVGAQLVAPTSSDPAGTTAAVVLLDDELRVVGLSPASRDRSARLLPLDRGNEPAPAAALNVAAQLLANEHGVSDGPPVARVHAGGGEWVTVRAARVPPSRLIAVSMDLSTGAERLDLFVRAFALSHREGEVVDLLAAGATTAEVATGLTVTEHTVQDHLKSVFAKSGVRSRRELLARVLGSRRPWTEPPRRSGPGGPAGGRPGLP